MTIESLRHHFAVHLPALALIALVGLMAVAPKIGPVILIAATLAALATVARPWEPGTAARLVRTGRFAARFGWNRSVALLAILAIYATASLAWMPDPGSALARAPRLIGEVAVITAYGAVIALLAREEGRARNRSAAITTWGYGAACVAMATSLALLAPTKPSPDSFANRAVVIFGLAAFAVAAHVLASSWTRRRKILVLAGVGAAALATALSSNSQTAIAALFCGGGFAALTRVLSPSLRRALVYGTGAVCLAMPLVVLAVRALPPELFELAFFQHSSAGDRLTIWQSYLELVRQKPLLGWGLEGSREFAAGLLADPVAPAGGFRFSTHPHNAFLQAWTDLGAIGAVLVCGLAVSLGLRIEALPAAERTAVYGLFAGIMVTSAISHGAFQSWWIASMAILTVSVIPLTPDRGPAPPGAGAGDQR